MVIWEVHKKSS